MSIMNKDVCLASMEGVEPGVALFRSLGDPARLATRRLAAGEARVSELTAEPRLAQSTVSARLVPAGPGLVAGRMEGRRVFYFVGSA